MKRLFVTLGLAASLISFSSFANEISPDVWKSFYHSFSKAENISWTEVDGMMRIGFTLNGQQHFAYYSDDELLVVATEIKTEALPASLQKDLATYADYKVTQVYELEKNNSKEYCVVLDKDSKHFTLKGRNKWRVYVEERK